MGFFDAINRTRQFRAVTLTTERLLKEIHHDLDSLVIELERANGVVNQYESKKIKSIGQKF